MAGYPHLPLFVKDYLVDTTHLSLEQVPGPISTCLCMHGRRGCELRDDDRQLAASFDKLTLKKWKAIRPALEPFFTIQDGTWSNKRLAQEWQYVREVSEKRAAAGARGGRPRSNENSDLEKQKDKPGISKPKAPTPTPTYTDANASEGAPSPKELAKQVFDSGITLFSQAGTNTSQSRSILGKAIRDHGAGQVLAALAATQREGANRAGGGFSTESCPTPSAKPHTWLTSMHGSGGWRHERRTAGRGGVSGSPITARASIRPHAPGAAPAGRKSTSSVSA